jgi:hypothetical protein
MNFFLIFGNLFTDTKCSTLQRHPVVNRFRVSVRLFEGAENVDDSAVQHDGSKKRQEESGPHQTRDVNCGCRRTEIPINGAEASVLGRSVLTHTRHGQDAKGQRNQADQADQADKSISPDPLLHLLCFMCPHPLKGESVEIGNFNDFFFNFVFNFFQRFMKSVCLGNFLI